MEPRSDATTDEAKTEIQALTDLVSSPGWALLVKAFAHIATPAHVLDAAHGLLKDSSAIGSHKLEIGLRQILSEGSAVAAVLSFPRMRVEQLTAPKSEAEPPRGMPLSSPDARLRNFVRRG